MEVHKRYLPKITDPRGNLSFIQFPDQIPFEIKRVFWTYNVPGGGIRGGHAYKVQEEVIIAISGSFDVIIKDVKGKSQRIHLNRGYEGVHLPPNTWRHLENFSTNSVSLHLSSSVYDENDYILDYDEFTIKER
jgi:glyoxylate utilization-related uncharacterized protein